MIKSTQQDWLHKLQHLCHQQIEGVVGIGPNLIDKSAKPSLYMLAAKVLYSGFYGFTGGSLAACTVHQQIQGRLFCFLRRDLHNPRHSGNTMTEVMRHEKNAIDNMAAK